MQLLATALQIEMSFLRCAICVIKFSSNDVDDGQAFRQKAENLLKAKRFKMHLDILMWNDRGPKGRGSDADLTDLTY